MFAKASREPTNCERSLKAPICSPSSQDVSSFFSFWWPTVRSLILIIPSERLKLKTYLVSCYIMPALKKVVNDGVLITDNITSGGQIAKDQQNFPTCKDHLCLCCCCSHFQILCQDLQSPNVHSNSTESSSVSCARGRKKIFFFGVIVGLMTRKVLEAKMGSGSFKAHTTGSTYVPPTHEWLIIEESFFHWRIPFNRLLLTKW